MEKNEKQKTIDEEPEPEMMINQRMENMCEYERKQNPQACEGCDGQADPLNPIFCAINTIKWRLSQVDKTLQTTNNNLSEIIRIMKEK